MSREQKRRLEQRLASVFKRLRVLAGLTLQGRPDRELAREDLFTDALSRLALYVMREYAANTETWDALSDEEYDRALINVAAKIMRDLAVTAFRRVKVRRSPLVQPLLPNAVDDGLRLAVQAGREYRDSAQQWTGSHRRLIETAWARKLSDVKSLAAALNLSERHVSRLLKDIREGPPR